jgi:small-conductance mechanosensitive channel
VLLQRRIRRFLQWGALVLWFLTFLDRTAVRDRFFAAAGSVLDASVGLGKLQISLFDVLAFVLVIWAAFLLSRLLRFVLDQEVFPHTSLRRGLPYAISRTLHIATITLGFVIALSTLGMEMTQLTILMSAFTIGVGFGLQNIFNNFVSGLIVLFERPVQVGDMIQMDDAVGIVERIGIRASVMRAANGSEVIVPNGKLISDRVVNWTLSRHERVIDVPIAVTLQSDPRTVIATLENVARAHSAVLPEPPPQAIVTRLGPDWMGVELRVAIREVERWMLVRSELAVAAAAALREAQVALR